MSDKPRRAFPKTDARYWLQRGKLILDPRSNYYTLKLQVAGHRESFPLRLASKDAAASKAAGIYRDVVSMGWEDALKKHKPESVKPDRVATVGELIATVRNLVDVRPMTMTKNATAFRRIVGDICGIKPVKSRYATFSAGREEWLAKIESISLERITPAAVKRWVQAFVAEKSVGDVIKSRSARTSANSTLRQAMSLFSRKLLPFLRQSITLPDPLPFHEIKLFARQSSRYAGKIDLPELMRCANEELRASDPEAFKSLLLGLFLGLRRSEMDKLRWSSFDFEAGSVSIVPQVDYSPKAETSLGSILLDPEAAAIFKALREASTDQEYVLSGGQSVQSPTWTHYRAKRALTRAVKWLREHGVDAKKPLHELRKEAGSLVCSQHGLLAASRFLRHADVAITASTYVAQRERATVGLGKLLAPKR